ELFKERIDVILNDYDDTCARLRIMKSGYSSRLCIGVPYYALNQYLEDVPRKFELAYPDVKLQYSVGDPHEVTKLYARGKN
ncbi:MAG: substrate-binding domain-containing protein, partial [Oscillospiraceae bacterium]|nr:substrate-binding domain-containing protein [Oscillospiraceae bacterium]